MSYKSTAMRPANWSGRLNRSKSEQWIEEGIGPARYSFLNQQLGRPTMRILVVGAGAIGGYFGGRMLEAGRDVSFLVRPRRAGELASAGLVIKSPNGDVTLKTPPTVQAEAIRQKFDVILLSCKAYDLDDAMKSLAPAVGEGTSIIPLLNGMRHLD